MIYPVLMQFPDLVATDVDTTANGVITYSLTGADSQYFVLNPQTAEITTKQVFDAELKQTYTDLQVTATDNGGLNSTVPLIVFVGDENDFSPFFTTEANATVMVSEALLPGASVFVVTAADSDVQGNILNFTLGGIQLEGQNDGGSQSPLMIDAATGAITVGEGGLDFELSSYYILTVTVRDSGSPPRSNSTHILVLLTDVNDNAPVFTPATQPFTVMENSPMGKHQPM